MATHVIGAKVDGLTIDMTQCVPLADTVKLTEIRISNTGKLARSLTLTHFADVVMGSSRSANASFIITSRDEQSGAVLAQNRWKNESGEQVMFMDMSGLQTSCTGDRLEFLGRYGTTAAPAALARPGSLPNSLGAALDPMPCRARRGEARSGADCKHHCHAGCSAPYGCSSRNCNPLQGTSLR